MISLDGYVNKREKIHTANMVGFRTIKTRRKWLGWVNLDVKRVDSHVESSPIIDERKVWVETHVTHEMLHSSKMDGGGMHLVLGQCNAGG